MIEPHLESMSHLCVYYCSLLQYLCAPLFITVRVFITAGPRTKLCPNVTHHDNLVQKAKRSARDSVERRSCRDHDAHAASSEAVWVPADWPSCSKPASTRAAGRCRPCEGVSLPA